MQAEQVLSGLLATVAGCQPDPCVFDAATSAEGNHRLTLIQLCMLPVLPAARLHALPHVGTLCALASSLMSALASQGSFAVLARPCPTCCAAVDPAWPGLWRSLSGVPHRRAAISLLLEVLASQLVSRAAATPTTNPTPQALQDALCSLSAPPADSGELRARVHVPTPGIRFEGLRILMLIIEPQAMRAGFCTCCCA